MEDVHFYGGWYGVWTGRPSPGWQFTMLDATFEGQREAAIREHDGTARHPRIDPHIQAQELVERSASAVRTGTAS